jgi:hypothetical protein
MHHSASLSREQRRCALWISPPSVKTSTIIAATIIHATRNKMMVENLELEIMVIKLRE